MTWHVDLVKNEWLAGYQVLVAQAFVAGDVVEVQTPEPEKWRELIMQPLIDSNTGDVIYPTKTPGDFLPLLQRAFRGSFVFASQPHDDDTCPFEKSAILPMKQAPSNMSPATL